MRFDGLLDTAIQAVQNVNREEDFLSKLERGGAKIFHHGAVFIRPSLTAEFNEAASDTPAEFEPPTHEPRLREVVMALQDRGIFFDDLVVDVGSVRDNQVRKWPYMIVTIPRLNAQIAVADQKNEALFVASPAIPFMNWALFEKSMEGKEGSAFENVSRVVHAGNWQNRMMDAVFGTDTKPPPKINLDGYVKAQRKSKYPLTEEMVVEMAKLWRTHPANEKPGLWPSQLSGPIPQDIVEKVTGDKDWQPERWVGLDSAGHRKYRGLTRTLSQTLDAHGCHYNVTEEMVVDMATLWRTHPANKKPGSWPSNGTGPIPRDIVEKVTGDKDWQPETWKGLDEVGRQKYRGLNRTLSQTLDAHGCHYNVTEKMVVDMATLWRTHPANKKPGSWPSNETGPIPHDIVEKVTGDKDWQPETWSGLDTAGRYKNRGLTRTLSQILDAHCPERGKMPLPPPPEPPQP